MEEMSAQPGPENGSFGSRLTSRFSALRQRLPDWPTPVWILLVVLATTLALGGLYFYLSPQLRQKLLRRPEPSPTPEAQPAKPPPAPLASGPQTYMVSGSTQGAPKITEAMVDPIDPAQASSQKWILKVIEVGNGAIGEVTATIYTDNGRKILSLNKTGTSENIETWEGSWTVSDSYDYKYVAILKAKNEAGKIHKVDLVLR